MDTNLDLNSLIFRDYKNNTYSEKAQYRLLKRFCIDIFQKIGVESSIKLYLEKIDLKVGS